MTKSTEAVKALHVVDSSVTEEAQERVHDVIVKGEIQQVAFRYGEKTILPFEIGVKFSGLQGFSVHEVDGKLLELPAKASENVAAQLAYDECVAKYSELTFTSLKLRAAQKPNGEIYLEADEKDRDNLIAFLIGEPPVSDVVYEDVSEIDLADEDQDDVVDVRTEEEKQQDFVIAHFGDGRENLVLNVMKTDDPNDIPDFVLSFTDADGEHEIVRGTGPELYDAAVNGISADRFNSDKDAAAEKSLSDEENGVASTEEDTKEVASEDDAKTEDKAEPDEGDVADEAHDDAEPAAEEEKFTLDEVKSATDEALALAVKFGVDINTIKGTGAKGNIRKGDVQKYIDENNLSEIEG